MAHTLQLVIEDALDDDEVRSTLSKCRGIVGHFKRSTVALNKLTDIQNKNNLEKKALIQDVATRWNST